MQKNGFDVTDLEDLFARVARRKEGSERMSLGAGLRRPQRKLMFVLEDHDEQRLDRATSCLEAEELPPDAARESADQLRTPTLDERARLYLRAVHGKQDFGSEAYSKARNRILNAMATDIAVKLEIPDSSETPVDHDETQWLNALSRRPYEYGYTRASAADADESTIAAAMASPRYVGMASPRSMYEEDFAAPEPEISPRRRQPFKFSLRTIGTLSVMVCAAAVIAGAGTLLFSRNDELSLAWFALPQRSAKTEVATPILRVEGSPDARDS